MTIRLKAGPAGTPATLTAAVERERLLRSELPRVRSAAIAWRNALGALLAGLLGFGLVKGRSDIGQVAEPWAIIIGILLLVSLVCGTSGAFLIVRAAHGRPFVASIDGLMSRRLSDHHEALDAARALRWGVGFTLACAAVLVGAVAVMWYAPAAQPPTLLVTSPESGAVCGKVGRIDRNSLIIRSLGGEVAVTLSEVIGLQPMDSCPTR